MIRFKRSGPLTQAALDTQILPLVRTLQGEGSAGTSAGIIATASANPEVAARIRRLESSFRCLVCQNETITDSTADLAADLRMNIHEQVQQGATDAQIREYMVTRYGDFVLYDPPFKTLTWILWLGPFVLLALAFARAHRHLYPPSEDDSAAAHRPPAATRPTSTWNPVMITFWIIAAVMLIGAILCAIVPLIQEGSATGAPKARALTVSLYRRELADADADLRTGLATLPLRRRALAGSRRARLHALQPVRY
ncbi:cytochrome c-type biogenesis protein CcmI [Burkholderia sp. D7]|nr:cytochrome c-type biogenesis protein CcmI [Burkholderia sp. D7]